MILLHRTLQQNFLLFADNPVLIATIAIGLLGQKCNHCASTRAEECRLCGMGISVPQPCCPCHAVKSERAFCDTDCFSSGAQHGGLGCLQQGSFWEFVFSWTNAQPL